MKYKERGRWRGGKDAEKILSRKQEVILYFEICKYSGKLKQNIIFFLKMKENKAKCKYNPSCY